MTATTPPTFTVPPEDQALTPARVRALGDTLRVHFPQKRGGGLQAEPVLMVIERLAVEIENRDRLEAALESAARSNADLVKQLQSQHIEERGMALQPTVAEIHTLAEAQWQAEAELDRARRSQVAEQIPDEPAPTGDMAADVLARARWLSIARPAAKQYADGLRVALPAAEAQESEICDESDRLAGVSSIVSALLPPGDVIDVTEAPAPQEVAS